MEGKNNKEFFNCLANEFEGDIKSLNWGSKRTQYIRFRLLSEIGSIEDRSVLDVGCGFADLYEYLEASSIKVKYTGIDVSDKVCDIAKEKRPDLDIRLMDIMDAGFVEKFDYVFASGVFALKFDNCKELVFEQLRKMYSTANIAVGVNFLSSYNNDPVDKHIQLYSPEDILTFAKTVTPYVSLRHDYLPHDFTLYMYKKENLLKIEEREDI